MERILPNVENFILYRCFYLAQILLSYPGTFMLPIYFYLSQIRSPTQILLSCPDTFILPRYFYPTQILLLNPDIFILPRYFYSTEIFLSYPDTFILPRHFLSRVEVFMQLKYFYSVWRFLYSVKFLSTADNFIL